MAVATTATIKTQLVAGSYADDTLDTNNIFDYIQYDGRRKYPSCDIETHQPESTIETKKSTDTTVGFKIRYYQRNLGERGDEVAAQKAVEGVILTQMERMVLQDHKIVFESKQWTREQINRTPNHPSYLVSTLTIVIRQINATTAVADGTLKFVKVGSTVDSAPASDYTYTNVYDVDFTTGYRDVEMKYTGSNIPFHFAGDLNSRFIANIHVKTADMGTTGEKVNNMDKLTSLGEHPRFKFEYVNETDNEGTITNTFTCLVESSNFVYRTGDAVVFRVIAKLITDVTVVMS